MPRPVEAKGVEENRGCGAEVGPPVRRPPSGLADDAGNTLVGMAVDCRG